MYSKSGSLARLAVVTILVTMIHATNSKKLLFIMTNTAIIEPDHPTGAYLPEFAHPYNILSEQHEIVFASPKGGLTPIDPGSLQLFKDDTECNAFLANSVAMSAINNTLRLDQVKASDFDLIFFPGGHGPMFDLTDNPEAQRLTKDVYEAGGIVSAVCHGVCGLVNVKLHDGSLLIKGRKITGFSNAEEDAVDMTKKMPFLLETRIKEQGGLYEKAKEDWGVKVVVDGRLVTGQNPASATELGKELSKLLS